MKNIYKLLFFIFLSFSLSAQQGKPIIYNKPLPSISAKGVVRLSDGKKMKIKDFNAPDTKVFFLIRHAEKDTAGGTFADLNPVGRGRAEALLRVFQHIPLHAVYSTSYARVLHTVEPLAKNKNKKIEIYDPKMQADLMANLLENKGKYILIGGHSNTIPSLANILKNENVEQNLEDNQYGCIFIVIAKKIGDATITKIYY